jgi:DNA-binding transcriptional LysR family regulator
LPLHRNDLADHDCIRYRATSGTDEWQLTGPDGMANVAVRGVISTNNNEAVRVAAISGLGVALLPAYLVFDDMRAGRLERVLPGHCSEMLRAYTSPH